MKKSLKITAILIAMFVIAQLLGLYVINFYLSDGVQLPYGFDNQNLPPVAERTTSFYLQLGISFIVSFAIAVFLILLLMKIQSRWFIRAWFFIVTALGLGITFTVITTKIGLIYPAAVALLLGLIFAYYKLSARGVIIHNLTEILIYPGIAAIFVALFNLWVIIALLIVIAIYDAWAVWHSKVMMNIAKFQVNNLGLIGGFMIPYASKKTKEMIKLLKIKYKNKIPTNILKKKKIKVGVALLGGGDIVYTAIGSGVFLKTFHSIPGALTVLLFATIALTLLMLLGDRKKPYPAMPYLVAGIFLGMIIGRLFVL